MGRSGSGQSGAINALLGYDCLLPSHSLRSSVVTKVPTYLRHNESSDPNEKFVCEIEFLSETDLCRIITNVQQARISYYDPDQQRAQLIWPKIGLLGPSDTLVTMAKEAWKYIGDTQRITSTTINDFRKVIRPFIDGCVGGPLWHIVSKVTLKIKSDFLKEVGVMIDLPPAVSLETVRGYLGVVIYPMIIFEDQDMITNRNGPQIVNELIQESARTLSTQVASENIDAIYAMTCCDRYTGTLDDLLKNVEGAEAILDCDFPGLLDEWKILRAELDKIHNDTGSHQMSQEREAKIFRMFENRVNILTPTLTHYAMDQLVGNRTNHLESQWVQERSRWNPNACPSPPTLPFHFLGVSAMNYQNLKSEHFSGSNRGYVSDLCDTGIPLLRNRILQLSSNERQRPVSERFQSCSNLLRDLREYIASPSTTVEDEECKEEVQQKILEFEAKMDARAYEFIANPVLNDPELLPGPEQLWEHDGMREYLADWFGSEIEGGSS